MFTHDSAFVLVFAALLFLFGAGIGRTVDAAAQPRKQ
jgi:hypothetical protein